MAGQTIKTVKKSSKATLIVTLLNVFAAVMMTISWFLPIASDHGESYSLFNSIYMEPDSDAVAYFWICAAIYAVSIIWAAIPKMWAAIVATIYVFLPASLCYFIAGMCLLADLNLGVGSVFMVIFSSLLIVLSFVKLVFAIKDKKKRVQPFA